MPRNTTNCRNADRDQHDDQQQQRSTSRGSLVALLLLGDQLLLGLGLSTMRTGTGPCTAARRRRRAGGGAPKARAAPARLAAPAQALRRLLVARLRLGRSRGWSRCRAGAAACGWTLRLPPRRNSGHAPEPAPDEVQRTSAQHRSTLERPPAARICVNRASNLLSSTWRTDNLHNRPTIAGPALFLSPAEYIDCDHPASAPRPRRSPARIADPAEQARAALSRPCATASATTPMSTTPTGRPTAPRACWRKPPAYCVGKAALYVALCRAFGIPARIGLADVKNHLATPRLLEAVGTDLFAYHGYVEIMPAGAGSRRRRRSTSRLCQKLGVPPLDFRRRGRRADAAVRRGRPRVHELRRAARHVLRRAGEIPDRGMRSSIRSSASPAACAATWKQEARRR